MKADSAVLDQIEYTRPLVLATYTEEALINPKGVGKFFVEGWQNAWLESWLNGWSDGWHQSPP